MSETPPDPAAALAALRAEIDTLDESLHGLLVRRAEVVQRLASSAAKPAGTTLRPGREARILRRLLAAHHGPMPRATLVQLWREIFAGSVAQQSAFSVVLPNDPALARIAAAHFGVATPLRLHPSPGRALSALMGREASAAVLPWPRESDTEEEAWWWHFDAPHLQVIARLPFFHQGEPPLEAAVVALYPTDPTEHDAALLRIELPGTHDRSALATRCPGGRIIMLRRDGTRTRALVETEALPPGAPLPEGAALLGRYAIPERGAPAA